MQKTERVRHLWAKPGGLEILSTPASGARDSGERGPITAHARLSPRPAPRRRRAAPAQDQTGPSRHGAQPLPRARAQDGRGRKSEGAPRAFF